jgi:hypothetical protein
VLRGLQCDAEVQPVLSRQLVQHDAGTKEKGKPVSKAITHWLKSKNPKTAWSSAIFIVSCIGGTVVTITAVLARPWPLARARPITACLPPPSFSCTPAPLFPLRLSSPFPLAL